MDRVYGVLSFRSSYYPVEEALDAPTPNCGCFPVGTLPDDFTFELGSHPSSMLFFQLDFERVELPKLFNPDASMESNPAYWTREGWWISSWRGVDGTVWAQARKHEKCAMRRQQSMRSTSSWKRYGSRQIVQMSLGSVKLVRVAADSFHVKRRRSRPVEIARREVDCFHIMFEHTSRRKF